MEEQKANVYWLIIKKAVVYSFYLFGVGGLIAWNAILSDLDFFEDNVNIINRPILLYTRTHPINKLYITFNIDIELVT